MDALETSAGKRGRAPVAGAADSDIPARSSGKKCRAGDLRLAFVAKMEVAREHDRRRHSGMNGGIGAQKRKGPGAQFAFDGGWPALSGWVPEERNRVLGRVWRRRESVCM